MPHEFLAKPLTELKSIQLKDILIGIAAITLAGLGSAIFIHALMFSVSIFQSHWQLLVFAAPIAGILMAKFAQLPYFKHSEQLVTPMLAPFIFITSCISHLVGASVGRESAAVQIGASLSESVRRFFLIGESKKGLFLNAGVAAGFGAAFQMPLASFLFGLEYKRKIPSGSNIIFSAVGSLVGCWIGSQLKTPHWEPALSQETEFSFLHAKLWLIPILVSLLGMTYTVAENRVHRFSKRISLVAARGLTGLIFIALTLFLATPRYNNLGKELVDASFTANVRWQDLTWKALFTLVASAGNWIGGFFVPLMALATVSAAVAAKFFQVQFISTIVGASCFLFVHSRLTIPLTSIALSFELFGANAGIISLPAHLLIFVAHDWQRRRAMPPSLPMDSDQ